MHHRFTSHVMFNRRYFQSHNGLVEFLKMCPQQELFMSGSGEDHSFRLWDVRSDRCQGYMNMAPPNARPDEPIPTRSFVASFDPTGLAFALGTESQIIKLYDLRTFDKGPFSSFSFESESDGSEWHDLKFSPDGRKIMISTSSKVNMLERMPLKRRGTRVFFCVLAAF